MLNFRLFKNSLPQNSVLPSGTPFVSDSEWGNFRFRFQDENGKKTQDDLWLRWKDFNEHVLITGGSGSGKTSTVLQQIYEGVAFKAGHHANEEKRRNFQVGGLVIEAKGDFAEKTRLLAERYHRPESVVYFGPDHPEFVYDPFGDPNELPLQKAHKMNEILKAASGGKEGNDPFWNQASQKLMANLFLLHDAVQKGGYEVPPLSFQYLNLLCMDKGRSANENFTSQDFVRALQLSFEKVRSLLLELDWEFVEVWRKGDPAGIFQQKLNRIRRTILEMSADSPGGIDNQKGKEILGDLESTREDWLRLLEFMDPLQVSKKRRRIAQLFNAVEEIHLHWKAFAREAGIKKSEGPLVSLLGLYNHFLERQGIDPEKDLIYSYFQNEYLNPVNERTSGSISMVVSNALMPFVMEPLGKIFGPRPTFDFTRAVDEGLLVVLDMPSARFGVAQLLASLIMKIDFFRTMLNRSRLRKSNGDRVNQGRQMIYLCDEFGSVATTGDQTGEASFLDKVREYQCSCILAMQGLPSLLRKFSDKEVDALLQNCGTKVFLRNDDPSTNDYASRSLGEEIKVRLNQNVGAMEHVLDQQKKWGSRPYTTHYEKAARFSPDQFVMFRVGEGVLRLPARFGEKMVRKVWFDFNPISKTA